MDPLARKCQQTVCSIIAVSYPKIQSRSIVAYRTRRGRLPTILPPNSFLVRKPIQKGIPIPKTDLPELQYGQHIYIYNNIQTDQVVYSLTRHLNVCAPTDNRQPSN